MNDCNTHGQVGGKSVIRSCGFPFNVIWFFYAFNGPYGMIVFEMVGIKQGSGIFLRHVTQMRFKAKINHRPS